LVDLPENTTDAANQVTQGCAAASGNTFTVTGRGGLPRNPSQPFAGRSIWRDVRAVRSDGEGTDVSDASPSEMPLREARDWVIDGNGRVQLVAGQRNHRFAEFNTRCDRPSVNY
jgi:large exoprotein involved in heme utilization and adhesion